VNRVVHEHENGQGPISIASLKDFSVQNKPVFCRRDLLSSSYDFTITNVYQQYFKITF